MIRIYIGTSERSLEEATPGWINRQINDRRADGTTICVRVRIDCPGLQLGLQTSTCPGGGGRRHFRPKEQMVIDLWKGRGLADPDFTGGNLIAFLEQLENRVGVC